MEEKAVLGLPALADLLSPLAGSSSSETDDCQTNHQDEEAP